MSINELISDYKRYIIGFLLVVLIYLTFVGGLMYSCRDGVLYKDQCVAPKTVDLIQVCEYNSMTCFRTCQDFMVKDKDLFYNGN